MYAKSFMALDGNGRLTGARTAQTAPYDRYTCHLCGSVLQYGLILHAGSQQEAAWFEHDQLNVANKLLMGCSYPDPEVKEDARQRKLKLMLAAVEPAPMVLSWHCVLCKRDYDGERHCRTFGTGIYSTELNLKTASPS